MKMFVKVVMLGWLSVSSAALAVAEGAGPEVEIQTSKGNIVIALAASVAPKTVKNFLTYAQATLYDGTVFHRVIPGFMIQGGGFDPSLSGRTTIAPIENEADNGLKNSRGTIAMARTGDPHSATSQFFINLKDNVSLDFRARNSSGWGYAVFGKVIEGMDVVDAIAEVRTTAMRGHRDVPVEPVMIKRVVVRQ